MKMVITILLLTWTLFANDCNYYLNQYNEYKQKSEQQYAVARKTNSPYASETANRYSQIANNFWNQYQRCIQTSQMRYK